DFVESRYHSHINRHLLADTKNSREIAAGGLSDRNDDMVNSERGDQPWDVFGGTEYFDSVNHRSLLVGIVVDETLHVEFHIAACTDFPGCHNACPTSSNQYYGLAFGLVTIRCFAMPFVSLVYQSAKHSQSKNSTESKDSIH